MTTPLGAPLPAFGLLTLVLLAAPATAQIRPDAVMLRYPDVSADHIAFRYADDLWIVDREGGVARRLTTADGNESFPRFSPDGQTIAFIGGYDGGSDIYSLSIEAGIPLRITHHPAQEMLSDWTPDGDGILFWTSAVSGLARAPRILRVAAGGGQPEPLPVPYGTFGAIDETGTWLAYTPISREFRTWKRYQGGMAQDIWLFNLSTFEAEKITDHPGTDAMPMWWGSKVIFLSDRGEYGVMNLYAYDIRTKETKKLTDFREFDVKWPSIGPEDVVFEAGGKLFRHRLGANEPPILVDVVIPGERPDVRARTFDVSSLLAGASPGPAGVRLAIEARGEIFSLPVESGVTRNLTRTSGVREQGPAWSPDGKWIAYFSDRSGEYELTIRRSDGKTFEGADENGEERLTDLGRGWKSDITWAPSSKLLTFTGNDGRLHLYDLEQEELRTITTNPTGSPIQASWSADSGWITWSHRHSQSRLDALHLFEVASGEVHELTSGMFDDSDPVFDRNGDWLYFHSTRTFEPIYADLDTTWIYTNSRNLCAVPLRADVENPWAPENEEEKIEGEDEEDDGNGDGEDSSDEAEEGGGDDEEGAEEAEGEDGEEPVTIELEGFESRIMLLPADPGRLGSLAGAEGKVLFARRPRTGSAGEKPRICYFDMEEKEEKTVLAGTGTFGLVPKGDKIVALRDRELSVVDLAPDQEFEAIDVTGLVATIEPREEWGQMLHDVWRIYRDFFYDEGLHGVDWDAIGERYSGALEDATSRADVHYLIGEMISELNAGHAYNRVPPKGMPDSGPSRPVGLLGCDWELVNGAYRIQRILRGGEYDADARSPLARHGVDASVGDYLLAVNGIPVDASEDVYAAFAGTAGKPTSITLNATPVLDGNERLVLVEPVGSERSLRYRDWVAGNRALVEEKGAGRIGYVHVPDTGQRGQNELMRQFLGQMHRDALIVDERWNAGGQIPTRFIEVLNRPVTNYWAVRHGEDWTWPPVGHRGPKVMLINHAAGSGGDCFPYYFRQAGLGALIGTRTWGGLIGISGNPGLIDGAGTTVPTFGFYELDGTWGVEGYGVEPDIEVVDDPSKMVGGTDPQLEYAIEYVLDQLETFEFDRMSRPASADRSGSGVRREDR